MIQACRSIKEGHMELYSVYLTDGETESKMACLPFADAMKIGEELLRKFGERGYSLVIRKQS